MRFLSFRILVIYILMPPILYVVSLQCLQYCLKNKYEQEIREISACDRCMFDGSTRLKDAVPKNIHAFLRTKRLAAWGVKINISVKTGKGTVLYPEMFEMTNVIPPMPDSMSVASENYELISQGIVVNAEVILDHNKPLSNAILAFYILIFSGLLYLRYRLAVGRAEAEEEKKNMEIRRLSELEKSNAGKLEWLEQEKERLTAEFSQMRDTLETEKLKASKSEEQLIEEIVSLEKKMSENFALREQQRLEIEELKEQIRLYEKSKAQGKKDFNVAHKRFRNLYKNLIFGERALAGFGELPDDLKLKCEELIHQLNENPELVVIKRKVFNKKGGHQTILEVVFGYKGRLYFRRTKENKIEIPIIGDKNSQNKDLEYLNNLS